MVADTVAGSGLRTTCGRSEIALALLAEARAIVGAMVGSWLAFRISPRRVNAALPPVRIVVAAELARRRCVACCWCARFGAFHPAGRQARTGRNRV